VRIHCFRYEVQIIQLVFYKKSIHASIGIKTLICILYNTNCSCTKCKSTHPKNKHSNYFNKQILKTKLYGYIIIVIDT
jgi:hypothetical protein